MKTLGEVGVDLEKDDIQVNVEGMIEAVVVDQDQVQEPVLIETGLDVFNVGSIIILLKTVQSQIQKTKTEQLQQMFNLDKDKTTLKVCATNTYDGLMRTNSDDAIDHLNL